MTPSDGPLFARTTDPAPSAASDDLAEVRARLLAVLEVRGSRKAAWEVLRAAGVTATSLKTFYAHARDGGLERALERVVTPETVAAARALLANPPAPPPPRVAVSTLANQYYCELQVHLGTLHDVRVMTAELAAGAAGHAALEAEAEEISEEEVARRIEAGEAMGLVEMPLAAEVAGVKLVGRADRVQLEGASAKLVLEFKFSGRRDLYPSHVAQVEAYGTLLGAGGFDTAGLVHAVAVIPRGGPRPENVADAMARDAFDAAAQSPWPARAPAVRDGRPDPLGGVSPRRVDRDGYTLWVFPHDVEAAARDVGWALAYWRGERAPQPTDVPAKCRACPYNAARLCDAARAEPDGRFRAEAIDGRRGRVHLLVPAAR